MPPRSAITSCRAPPPEVASSIMWDAITSTAAMTVSAMSRGMSARSRSTPEPFADRVILRCSKASRAVRFSLRSSTDRTLATMRSSSAPVEFLARSSQSSSSVATATRVMARTLE